MLAEADHLAGTVGEGEFLTACFAVHQGCDEGAAGKGGVCLIRWSWDGAGRALRLCVCVHDIPMVLDDVMVLHFGQLTDHAPWGYCRRILQLEQVMMWVPGGGFVGSICSVTNTRWGWGCSEVQVSCATAVEKRRLTHTASCKVAEQAKRHGANNATRW